ncbi:MAG: DUF3857 domain-containing protein [Nibricoccus sp.]
MEKFSRLLWATMLLVAAPNLRAELPDWIKSVAKIPAQNFELDPPAVVLSDDTSVNVSSDGATTETHRVVIRLLKNAGARWAEASVFYNEKTDKVIDAKIWLIRNGSSIKEKTKRDWVDVSTGTGSTTVEETRKRQISVVDAAVAGDLCAYEICVRRSLLIALQAWRFMSDLPTQTTRVSVTVPAGFSMEPRLLGKNLPESTISADGRTRTWTLGPTKYRPDEPFASETALIDADLYVQIVPPALAPNFTAKSFKSWADVAEWVEKLNVESCDTNPAITAKVLELTAGCPDDLARIRVLSRFVQSLRYVASNQDLGKGAGYVARKASLVLSRGYGDCKDKANLLKSMLQVAGIKSYTASAQTHGYRKVHEEIPTPLQFNHAILCIAAPPDAPAQATVQVAPLGKLLIFDPTDKYTTLGDIPRNLQGSKIALDSKSVETLVSVPEISPEAGFRICRKASMELGADGNVKVDARIESHGYYGAVARASWEDAATPAGREKFFRMGLSDGFRSAKLLSQNVEDDAVSGRFLKILSCENKRFAQRLQGNMVVVKMEIFSRDNLPSFSKAERQLPITLYALSLDDEIHLKIPPGLKVEDLPEKATIESAFGSYSLTLKAVDDTVVLNRRLTLSRMDLPVEDYAKIRQFLNDVARADRCSIILK